MLQSVVRQTYTNWELVLVDASDADKRLERRLPKTVPGTIVYEPIENGGIALNTTRGFALAHGEYITLLDHDDVLYPNALFEVVQTIQNTRADFVYSDEIVLSADLKELGGYHFKPDFAPDYLRGVNFITHLAVFSRPLLDAAGAYESKEFDGAQDHDLILRLTEKAQRIEHIKKVACRGRLHRRGHGGQALRRRGGGARHRRAAQASRSAGPRHGRARRARRISGAVRADRPPEDQRTDPQ